MPANGSCLIGQGCVHLALAGARYYNVHLPVGAEVFVF
jgi:hypothetical protein